MQPQWDTPEGSLGVIPEGLFYKLTLSTDAGGEQVYYSLLSGQLPSGIQVTASGTVEGVPKNLIDVQGVPTEVDRDVTSTFAIRAYTRKIDGSVNRINDRTFSLTVTGQDVPDFITPSGSLGTYFDGSEVDIQLQVSDSDPSDVVKFVLANGELPPGLTLDPVTGMISGVIVPLTGLPDTADAGWDMSQWDQYGWDFRTRSATKNFQFTIEITDGKSNNLRTFELLVYSRDSMTADDTDVTADNTFITADTVGTRSPVIITPEGSIGKIRSDNYFAFQFESYDPDGDTVEYSITVGEGIGFDSSPFSATGDGWDRGSFSLPPGLSIDTNTGWFYGYIPDSGATETTYDFAVQVRKKDDPSFESGFYYYSITISGNIDTEVNWVTPSNLGTINNGSISDFAIEAVARSGTPLQYKIVPGSDSKLPQGLTLLETGEIAGRVSFNTFTLDKGTTTFDESPTTRLIQAPTTFDLTYTFSVNAYAPQTEQLGYQVNSISVTNLGSGYTSQPTITISAPPNIAGAVQATAGVASIDNGQITAIKLGNPGRGYTEPPTVTITGGGGANAAAVTSITEVDILNSVSVIRDFSITINPKFSKPYQSLYIKAMPDRNDRALITNLLEDQDLIPYDSLYRPSDSNFGKASDVKYVHAYGLDTKTLEQYVSAVSVSHYRKQVVLGEIQTARATNSAGEILYEVVYSKVVDDLVNNKGESVGKSVTLPYPITEDGSVIAEVYPNSLINMRNQVFDTIGKVTSGLPQWMISEQADGRILGFTPSWVIAYVKPGESDKIKYNIDQSTIEINQIDFDFDRYELDNSQTHLWDTAKQSWIPSPAITTTFDRIDRPSGLTDIGTVAYATNLAYSQINYRTLDEIALLGGIDGAVSRSDLDGKTLIFRKQEQFSDLTIEDAFTKYLNVYDMVTRTEPDVVSAMVSFDTVGYDADGYEEPQTEVIVSGGSGGIADPEYNNGAIIDVTGDGSDFFKREVTTNGVRIMGAGTVGGQTAVPDAWLEKVARMVELFTDPNGASINETFQRAMIKTLSGDAGTYHAGLPTLQRVARGSGAEYTPNFLTDAGIASWNLTNLFDTHVQNDMVWYLNSSGVGYGDGDTDAQEVIEHVFHTLHMHGLPADDIKLYEFLAADWQSGPLYAAMEEAYDAGKWDPSGYNSPADAWKTDSEAFEVAAKEYLYLLNFCMFEYTELWEGGSLAPEWTDDMRTQAGILANNPLGYAFHNQYIAPVISKPSLATIRSIFQDGNTPAQDNPALAGESGYVVDISVSGDPLDGTFGTFDVGALDAYEVLTTAQRLGIWRISVSSQNIVTLSLVQTNSTDDVVTVLYGTQYNNTQLYLPNAPTEGLLFVTWSYVPEEPKQQTTFDLNSTTFSAPADSWSASDQFDKYIVFPKQNILG